MNLSQHECYVNIGNCKSLNAKVLKKWKSLDTVCGCKYTTIFPTIDGKHT